MKRFKAAWAGPARLDFLEISEFIAEENPATARKVVKRLRDKISKLHMQPERGRVVPELAKQGITKFRELIIPPWRVLYKTGDKIVFVVLVADGRRNLEDIFFKRIMR